MTAPRPLTQLQAAGPSARVIFRVVVIAVLVVLSLYLIYLLRRPLTWIFIAGFLAIALSGPVNFLSRRMKRGLAIALVYFALILLPVLIGAILVPPVVEQLNNLIQNLPAYAADLQEFVGENERLRELEADYNITAELQKQASTLPSRSGSSIRSSPRSRSSSSACSSSGRAGAGSTGSRRARDPSARSGSTGCSTGSATRSATTSPARSARRSSPACWPTSCC